MRKTVMFFDTKSLLRRMCLLAVAVSVTGCSLAKKIPGIGKKEDDGVNAEVAATPPNGLPYNSDRALKTGDVLRVSVYKGLRSSKDLFEESVTVGENGSVDLGKVGTAKVAGLKVSAAAAAIDSQFMRSARSAGRLTVHIHSVNGVGIVRVEGGVANPGVIVRTEGMSVKNAINAAGGKKTGAGTGFVYVSSRGVRKTLVIDGLNGGDPEAETILEAGDIVDVPAGL